MSLNWNSQSLQAATGGRWQAELCSPVEGFSIDTRSLRPGEVFVALKTPQRDGHAYIGQALAKGAVAALVSKPQTELALPQLIVDDTFAALNRAAAWQRARFSGEVIAVTGSSGKTGTKDLIRLLLGAGETHATSGNFNNHLGLPLSLLATADDRWQRSILEIGMNQPGEIAELTRLARPHCCVVTSVGPAHLEGVGSLDAVAREKASLCREAGADVDCYIAAECLSYGAFRNLRSRVTVIQPGAPGATLSDLPDNYDLLNYTTTEDPEAGLMIWWKNSPASGHFFSFPAISPGVRANTALALAVARAKGVDMETLSHRLREWAPARLRGEQVREAGRQWYVDCYNANPASMLDALKGFDRRFRHQARLFVVGGMRELGTESESWHRAVGAAIPAQENDQVVLIGLEAEWMHQGLQASGRSCAQVSVLDEALAARPIVEEFQGAVFLKGSRAYQLERLLPASERGQTC
ncbi:MAG: UDP-N-acetylmuramoyl-tripeptide--D-alanyl-D-alanine ligase [Opitutales bacterium]|nr:UDP-N-acetylmuramoyl-tripeptide--D-alanyl-D-alanine ligase [Opitutales bacterium]